MKLVLQRAYNLETPKKFKRILVDRLWPRGLSKERMDIDHWAKELTPSAVLRDAYHKNLMDFEMFSEVYFQELKQQTTFAKAFLEELKEEPIVHLVYASKNEKKNHAQLLKFFLEKT